MTERQYPPEYPAGEVTISDFATESGSFTTPDQGSGTVSFTNTYHPDAVIIGIGSYTHDTSVDPDTMTVGPGGAVTGRVTDADGNVTGFNWSGSSEGLNNVYLYWYVMGLTV